MNRLTLILAINDARDMGQHAAIHNEGWESNPYPLASEPWCVWGASHNKTLERLAVAEMAIKDGTIAETEERLDASEPQPWSLIQSMLDKFFNTGTK